MSAHRQPSAMKQGVRLAVLTTGFSGLVAEIVLLRELVVVFSGNELSIGLILANWLLLEALGCVLPGRLAASARRVDEAYVVLSALFSAAVFAAVLLTRLTWAAWGVAVGQPLGLMAGFVSTLVVLLPVSLLHGAQFTFGCRLYARATARDGEAAAHVYTVEAIGTLVAGVSVTYLLMPYLHAVQIAAVLALLNAVAGLALLAPAGRGRSQAMRCATWLFALAAGWILFGGAADAWHARSVRAQWPAHNVVHHGHSRYSHIAVLENEGQYTFFLDGAPALMVPIPDTQAIDLAVHLPLLGHPRPQRIGVIGGGAGGVIDAMLRHPSVTRVDYVERDPRLLDLLQTFATPLTAAEWNDPRVTIRHADGRRWLATTDARLDILLIGIPEPSSLQANRFFTREAFALALARLHDDGILVLGLPGSLAFESDALMRLNACIDRTLRDVFPYVRVLPGEGRNLFLASPSPAVTNLDARLLAARLRARGLPPDAAVPWHIENALHPGWREAFANNIADAAVGVNRDFKPLGLYYSMRHWTVVFAPALDRFFRLLEHESRRPLAAGALILALLASLRARRRPGGRGRLAFVMVTTGFTGMVLSLAVMTAFQAIHGYVLSWIGLLIASYMTGAAAGAARAGRVAGASLEHTRRFARTELGLLLLALLFPWLVSVAAAQAHHARMLPAIHAFFLSASFLAGWLTAYEFPLANALRAPAGADPSRTAGTLYALDLLGGWLGGMLASVVMLPVLGLHGACMTLAALKFIGYLLMTPPTARG